MEGQRMGSLTSDFHLELGCETACRAFPWKGSMADERAGYHGGHLTPAWPLPRWYDPPFLGGEDCGGMPFRWSPFSLGMKHW